NEFFSKVIRGITEIANLNDYNVFFFESNETPEKEHDSLKIFMEQRLCGLIIAPVAEDDPETRKALRRIHRGGTPIILVDRDISGEKFDGVFADNRNGAYAAVETFIREGHRKISVISGPQSTKPGRERYEGYKKALEAHGIEIREEYVQNSDFRVQRAYECANRLLALPDPPTAVFTSNNLSTLGFLKSMREHRITVGRDISIIGYDVIEALEILDYNISVVQRDAVEQGRVAMRLMIERLRGKNAPEGVKELMPYRIVLKGSEKYDWRRHEG
ncbi:MAG: substrate-binding domain-containing protein, partial [Clostridiales Family XIII bacterium]|nr:substrate-binding domain-containing protein [Clostridiales Family XIII bacterium]